MTADTRPWIVYYPAGRDLLAQRFLTELQAGRLTEDAAERMMLKLNAVYDSSETVKAHAVAKHIGDHDVWAFGRLDTPDFTHVITRGRRRTLWIYWFVVS